MSGEQATTRRAPRSTARGATTRQRIVAAATDLMYVQGVGATSLDEVIEVVSTQIDRVPGFQDQHLRRLDSLRGPERWRDA